MMITSLPQNFASRGPSPRECTLFFDDIMYGRREGVEKFLGKYPDAANMADKKARPESTPLHYAARFNHSEIALFLLDSGAAINAKDLYGMTPLMCAAAQGNENIIKLLLEKNASFDDKDVTGKTALDHALYFKNYKIADLLAQHARLRAAELACRELAEEIADFSSTLKRPIPAPRKLSPHGGLK